MSYHSTYIIKLKRQNGIGLFIWLCNKLFRSRQQSRSHGQVMAKLKKKFILSESTPEYHSEAYNTFHDIKYIELSYMARNWNSSKY